MRISDWSSDVFSSDLGDHFHAQLGFPVIRAATHRGTHPRGDVGIEKIHIEADVQMHVAGHVAQYIMHDLAHAFLVDCTHIVDFDAGLAHQALLLRIDTAYSDLAYVGCRQCGAVAA